MNFKQTFFVFNSTSITKKDEGIKDEFAKNLQDKQFLVSDFWGK